MAKKKTRKKKTSITTGLWKDLQSVFKRSFTKQTGIPTTKAGVKRKLGTMIVDFILGLFRQKPKESNKK